MTPDTESSKSATAIALRDRVRNTNFNLDSGASDSVRISTDRITASQIGQQFLGEFPHHKAIAIYRALENLSKHTNKRFFSFIDLSNFKGHNGELGIKDLNRLFDPTTGSIALPVTLEGIDSPLANFFKANSKRTYQTADYTELRGRNYFVARENFKKKSTSERFELIQSDLTDGIVTLSQINREEISNQTDYLLYLGVIDYLKIHSQTLFHALTYEERYGITIQDPEKRKRYMEIRQRSTDLMEQSTRMYYQTLFGTEYDDERPKADEYIKTVKEIISYIQEEDTNELGPTEKSFHRFKYPEVNHPLIIALGAQEAVLKNPKPESLIGIPTGGTEAAITIRLLYEILRNSRPELIFIPLSIHSEVKTPTQSIRDLDYYYNKLSHLVKEYYADGVAGRQILLIDDNSTSGQTLELMSRVLRDNLASVAIHVVEYDARRLLDRDTDNDTSFFDPRSSPSTMGLTQLGMDNKYSYLNEIRKRLK